MITKDGLAIRQPYMSRLKTLLYECDARGIIVDVTITRLNDNACPSSQTQHLNWVKRLTTALLPFRNVYFDLGNECNVRQDQYVSWANLRELVDAVHAIDGSRLCSASITKVPSDIPSDPYSLSEFDKYINTHLDFALLHGLYEKSLDLRQMLDAHGIVIPINMNETPRRGSPYNISEDKPSCPTAYWLWQQLAGADYHGQGVAGWFFHNGNNPAKDVVCSVNDGGPYKCFYMNNNVGMLLAGQSRGSNGEYGQLDLEERLFIYKYGPKYRGW